MTDHLDTMQALVDFAAAALPLVFIGILAFAAVEETKP